MMDANGTPMDANGTPMDANGTPMDGDGTPMDATEPQPCPVCGETPTVVVVSVESPWGGWASIGWGAECPRCGLHYGNCAYPTEDAALDAWDVFVGEGDE